MKKYIFQNLSVVIFRRHLPVIISAKAKEVEDFLRFTIYHIKNGVLQTKVNRKNEKSPAKFTRPKMGITKQAGEKSHRQPG